MAARTRFNVLRHRASVVGALTLAVVVANAPVASATHTISVDDFLESYKEDVVEPTECYQVINYLTGWRGIGEIVKTTPQQAVDKLVPDLVVSSNVELNVTTEAAYLRRAEETKTKMAELWVDKGKECGAVVTAGDDPSDAPRSPGHATVTVRQRPVGLAGLFFSS